MVLPKFLLLTTDPAGDCSGISGEEQELWKDHQDVRRLPGGQKDCREVGGVSEGCQGLQRDQWWGDIRRTAVVKSEPHWKRTSLMNKMCR